MATVTISPLRATTTFANMFRRELQRSEGLFLRSPPRQRCRIFVGAFAESAFHPPGQANRRFAKLVAQMVRGRQGLLPTLVPHPRRLQQNKLSGTRFQI